MQLFCHRKRVSCRGTTNNAAQLFVRCREHAATLFTDNPMVCLKIWNWFLTSFKSNSILPWAICQSLPQSHLSTSEYDALSAMSRVFSCLHALTSPHISIQFAWHMLKCWRVICFHIWDWWLPCCELRKEGGDLQAQLSKHIPVVHATIGGVPVGERTMSFYLCQNQADVWWWYPNSLRSVTWEGQVWQGDIGPCSDDLWYKTHLFDLEL